MLGDGVGLFEPAEVTGGRTKRTRTLPAAMTSSVPASSFAIFTAIATNR